MKRQQKRKSKLAEVDETSIWYTKEYPIYSFEHSDVRWIVFLLLDQSLACVLLTLLQLVYAVRWIGVGWT